MKTQLFNSLKYFNKFNVLSSIRNYTIYSKSSGNGKCGVAVIRVSGEKTREIVKSLTGSDKLKARYASLKKIFDPSTKVLIDNGLVLFFESPRSFTGEDCCEFQVHGGNAVVTALLNALSKIEGCRPAEPGEFTKRAFYSGKMDLTEVEGLADLIHAETEFQRRQAITQADGHLSKLYGKWREKLIRNIAHIEAFIDFSEDENIEDNVLDNVQEQLVNLTIEIEKHLADGRKGERLRDGVKMAIIGDTNVGKSSLMNLLVRRDVSIVTNVEGTTRDIIETPYDIGGYPIILADTAGLRKSDDIVESEGIARAKKYASNADLVIVMIDGEKLSLESLNHHHEFCENYLRRLGFEENAFDDVKMISIVNKIDKMNDEMLDCLKRQKILSVSCTKHLNIDKVIDEVRRNLEELCGNPNSESPTLSHARHRFYLEECLKYLHHFNESFHPEQEQDFAILVQSLRNSIRCIGRVTGEIRTDDILDVIFKDFCIGK